MSGVRTYNPSVRVGNWCEDLCLEEVIFFWKYLLHAAGVNMETRPFFALAYIKLNS